jgi:hypothetical protein
MKWRRSSAFALLMLLIFLSISPVVNSETIVRGFRFKGTLQPGLIVAVSQNISNTVEASPGNDAARIYGVVIDPSQAPLTEQQQGQQVFIATAGNYPVLVSDQNGPVKAGDYISISSVSGIGAKVSSSQPVVLGRALESFDGKKNVITEGPNGDAVGKVSVSIVPGKNPVVRESAAIPSPLKRIGDSIAGKNVSPLRIYAAMAVFLIAAIIGVSILLVGIRSSIVAIGRNPLSRKSIMRGLFQAIMAAMLVLIIGVVTVYLLLKI